MRVRFRDVDGVSVRYYESGPVDSQPVVLVHGGGASADTWFRNLDPLGEVGRVYAPDLLGHGFTDLPPLTDERAPQLVEADHIVRFVDSLELEQFDLVGHSFGALIACLVYLADPARIRRLVLEASSSVFAKAERHEGAVQGAHENQLPALMDPTPENIRRRNTGSNYDRSDPFEEIVPIQMTALALPGRLEAFEWVGRGLLASAADEESRVVGRLEELRLPTLVVAGRDDPRCKLESVEEGVRRLPDVRLHVVDRCGHKPHSEHAAEFNDLVSAFLAGKEGMW